jgi:hypothetical protein
MFKHFLQLFLSLVVVLGFVQAQNPLLALLGNGSSSEERLLYKKPLGPYTLTIDGTRLVGDNYFHLDIRENGKPVSADTAVRVNIVPPEGRGEKSDFWAKYDGERFVIDPLPLEAKGRLTDRDIWLVTVAIQTPRGEATTEFGLRVYPNKPDSSFVFRVVSVGIPIMVLGFFLLVVMLRGVRLEYSHA